MMKVEDFGAVGDDPGNGTGTDDRAAFQAALNAGRKLVLDQAKTYRIDGPLEIPRFQQIFGLGGRSALIGWPNNQTGASRLIFTGSGAACFVNQDPAMMLSHGCFKNFIIRCEGDYPWIMDFHDMLDWTIDDVGMETPNMTTGGIRSRKIAPGNPSWVNTLRDVCIRLPDFATARTVDVDWSDSIVEGCHITGGQGAIDRGFGVRWINNQIERASYAGLTLEKRTNVKNSIVTGNSFDINASHGVVVDVRNDPTTTRVLHTVISGNNFRTANPVTSAAGGGTLGLLGNGNNYRLGPIVGNVELHPGVQQIGMMGSWSIPQNIGNMQA